VTANKKTNQLCFNASVIAHSLITEKFAKQKMHFLAVTTVSILSELMINYSVIFVS